MSEYDEVIQAAIDDADALEKSASLNLNDEELGSIQKLSDEMIRLEDLVESLNRTIKVANESLRHVREERLPEAMQKAEMKSIELESGAKLSVSKKYIGSITKTNEDDALDWFVKTKRAGVITPNLSIPVDKGHLEEAQNYKETLEKQGIPVVLKPSVHWQTLRAVVRELYENGEEVPPCISTHVINEAKIKRK